ncbi:hypothetical protein [Treponema sp.]|uniref:hypothetical protein n=1 Tax=Treponema sp. TaxID=166 RepID=UPI00298E4968|nr:hypothetical protein [Treponema sp.]MCQ2241467.1 hypothetical protein [Treponema sp.]
MKFNKTALISLAVITATFVLSLCLRAVPVSRIWNNYSVAYVEKTLPEETVLSYFARHSVENVISLGGQRIPFVSDFTPVLPQRDSAYLSERLSYFFDLSDTYSLYYIPKRNDSACVKALEEIVRDTNTPCGIDGKQQYPWLVPLIVLAVFFMFIFFSHNRKVFALSSASILVLSFSQVFYPVAAAAILYMLSCYLASRIWGRRKAISVLKKSIYIIIPLVVSVLCIMVLSISCAFLVLMCGASSVCALILLDIYEKHLDSKSSFKFVKIFGAPQMPLMHPGTAKHTLFCLVPLFLLLVIFLLSSRISTNAETDISIPVPVHSAGIHEDEKVLPGLKELYGWFWKAKSYPYKNLNENFTGLDPVEGETITVPRYEIVDDKIVESESLVMTYDEKFREGVDREIEELDYDAVEKLIKKQGSNVSVVYRNSGESRGQTDGLGLILILVCIFVPVLLLLVYVLKSGRKSR